MKTIAVTKKGKDLVRIIPARFSKEKNKIGLKICLLENTYKTRYWCIGDISSVNSKTSEEITYHNSSEKFKTGCILIKENKKYMDIFPKVVDIVFEPLSPVPIPICKINFNFDSLKKYKNYKKKKKHYVLELKDTQEIKSNTIDFYLAPSGFDINKIMNSWRCINLLFIIGSIDVLVKGTSKSINEFYECISKGSFPLLNAIPGEGYTIIYKIYHQRDISENQISFYENHDYLAVLASTPISIRYGEHLSPPNPAYIYDILDLEKLDPLNAARWKKFFENLTMEISRSGIHKEGLIIPRD